MMSAVSQFANTCDYSDAKISEELSSAVSDSEIN